MNIGVELFDIEWDFNELDVLSETEREEVIKIIPTSCKEFPAPSSDLDDIENDIKNKITELIKHFGFNILNYKGCIKFYFEGCQHD